MHDLFRSTEKFLETGGPIISLWSRMDGHQRYRVYTQVYAASRNLKAASDSAMGWGDEATERTRLLSAATVRQ